MRRENYNLSTIGWKWKLPTKNSQTFFNKNFQTLYDVVQKKIENLEFVRIVKIEQIDSLKNNGTEYSLIFDLSSEETCKTKAVVDIATAGRHRGLSTNYIEHNLFHRSKLGRNFECQNTHIFLLISPHEVMQLSLLTAQWGLESELIDWYGDAASVPYDHLLMSCRHEQTIDKFSLQKLDPFPQTFTSRTTWNN